MMKKWCLGLGVLFFFLTLGGYSLFAGQDTIPLPGQSPITDAKREAMGICPPINLLDEDGNTINPIANINSSVPYSPKMTCGKCHDYDKITKGYHFQQGKGEKMGQDFQETYPWCTSPGQYGGRW